jgi:hypothetical protein
LRKKNPNSLLSFPQTNEHYVPPAIVAGVQFPEEDLDPVNDPFGFLREQIKQERALRIQLILILEENCTALFGMIWGLLSRESEEMVMQYAAKHGIIVAMETRDENPLLLWQSITAAHIVASTGIPHLDAQVAYEKYANVQQRSDETLLRFKERFSEAVKHLVWQLHVFPLFKDFLIFYASNLSIFSHLFCLH